MTTDLSPDKTYAVAKHDYTGTDGSSLSFKAGDKILLYAFNKDEEWWEGQIVGQEASGWFPKSYVEKLKRQMKPRDVPISSVIKKLQLQAFAARAFAAEASQETGNTSSSAEPEVKAPTVAVSAVPSATEANKADEAEKARLEAEQKKQEIEEQQRKFEAEQMARRLVEEQRVLAIEEEERKARATKEADARRLAAEEELIRKMVEDREAMQRKFEAEEQEVKRKAEEQAAAELKAQQEAEAAKLQLAEAETKRQTEQAAEAEAKRQTEEEAQRKSQLAADEAEAQRKAHQAAEEARHRAEEEEALRASEEAARAAKAAAEAEESRLKAIEAEKAKIQAEEAENARLKAKHEEEEKNRQREAEKARQRAAEEAQRASQAALPTQVPKERKRAPIPSPGASSLSGGRIPPVSVVSILAYQTIVASLLGLTALEIGVLWAIALYLAVMFVVACIAFAVHRKPKHWVLHGGVTSSTRLESFCRALILSFANKGRTFNPTLPALSIELRNTEFLTDSFMTAYKHSTCIPTDASAVLTAAECQSFILPISLLTHQDSPIPAMGSVHVRTKLKVLDPSLFESTRRGISVTQRAEIVSLRPVKKGTEALIVTKTYEGNKVILEDNFYMMAFHKTQGKDGEREFVHPELEDLSKLEKLDEVSLEIPAYAGREYAALCGDYNPIHLHAIPAKLFGFKKAIVHGMWIVGRAIGAAHAITKGPVQELDVFFRKPLFLPSKATISFYKSPSNPKSITYAVTGEDKTVVCINGTFNVFRTP